MHDLSCDVAIIGAGTAGLAAERAARRNGAATLLIDRDFAGPTCAVDGCMPSKLLIAAGDAAYAVTHAPAFGILPGAVRIDGAAVMARVRRERDRFVAATNASIAALAAETRIRATARFTGPTRLALDDGRGIAARAIVIACGSHAALPEPYRSLGAMALTNETVFELTDLPASLAVIGAGPLGLELGQAFARLGVAVAVFDQAPALKIADTAVEAAARDLLGRELALHLGVETTPARVSGGVRIAWQGASSGQRTFARVLVATGRPPNLGPLDLCATGLTLDDHGMPAVDRDTLQCGRAPIFMAGDADGARPVLHEASFEGALAGRNAAAFPDVTPGRRALPFTMMFTDPPLAVLGDPLGDGMVAATAAYADQGRAKVMARNVGLARLYADATDGRLRGATLFAPGMDHIAHLLALAITTRQTATDLLALPFYHPTLEEGLKPALREICAAVHAPAPLDRDEGSPAGG